LPCRFCRRCGAQMSVALNFSRVVTVFVALALPVAASGQGHGALWTSTIRGVNGPCGELITRFDLSALLRGRAIPVAGAHPDSATGGFAGPTPADKAIAPKRDDEIGDVREDLVERDILPAGPFVCRQFLLRHDARLLKDKRAGERRWSFQVFTGKAKFEKGSLAWSGTNWDRGEALPVAFKEPFHAFGRGDDFFFLTKSDKLFHSPKPAKGKTRRINLVWGREPVSAFITDADKNRTFLFLDSPKRKGDPALFELAEGVRLLRFDTKLYRPGTEGPENFRRLVGYSRVLLSLGLVKGAPTTKGIKKA
jgi:hypothetical protein